MYVLFSIYFIQVFFSSFYPSIFFLLFFPSFYPCFSIHPFDPQVSSGGKSPLNHMLPMVKQESVSPSPYHRKEPSPSGASHISEKDSKKSITPPNASKPKKPASKKRSRKSSGIKNEKNIPCKGKCDEFGLLRLTTGLSEYEMFLYHSTVWLITI